MIVTKIKGQNKIDKILVSRSDVEISKVMKLPLEKWVKQQLVLIAKKRKWKWYLDKEKNATITV